MVPNNINSLVGFYQDYQHALSSRDYQMVLRTVLSHVREEGLILPHPTKRGLLSRCYNSKKEGLSNLLFFDDGDGKNRWAAIQVNNFLNAIVVKDAFYMFNPSPVNAVKRAVHSIVDNSMLIDENNKGDISKNFGGFIVSQVLPYHYFYDALVNFLELRRHRNALSAVDEAQHRFVDLNSVLGCAYKGEASPTCYYVYPSIIAGRFLFGRNDEFMRRVDHMERRLHDMTLTIDAPETISTIKENKGPGTIAFWFGVSNGKRKWHQQIDGCVSIVRYFERQNRHVIVVLDGITARHGLAIDDHPDKVIENGIFQHLSGNERVSLVSLIGKDYTTKINVCKELDFFIAYEGTGAFVPLRVCRKPGILHSNEVLTALPGDYGGSVIMLRGDSDQADAKKQPDFRDYSVDPERVMKALLDIDLPSVQSVDRALYHSQQTIVERK